MGAPPLASELGDGLAAGVDLRELTEAPAGRVMSASNSSASRLLPITRERGWPFSRERTRRTVPLLRRTRSTPMPPNS
jgi:hypothetical protein